MLGNQQTQCWLHSFTFFHIDSWAPIQYKDAILPVKEIPLSILRPSYLRNEISYTGKMSLYWISPLVSSWFRTRFTEHHSIPPKSKVTSTPRVGWCLKPCCVDLRREITNIHLYFISVLANETLSEFTHKGITKIFPSLVVKTMAVDDLVTKEVEMLFQTMSFIY